LQGLVSARKNEAQVREAYYRQLVVDTRALSEKIVAPVTTEQIVLANMYNGEEMNEAASNGIVNYVVYGDVARNPQEAEAMIRASGYIGSRAMVEFINKHDYESYNALKAAIIAKANGRKGASAITEANIGIRAAKDELLRKGEKTGAETFLEIQEVEMNGTKVLGAMGSYQVLINMVLGKEPPSIVRKDDVTGVFKYLPRMLPIDYGEEIATYRAAVLLLSAAA
jgi:hypothetical protein